MADLLGGFRDKAQSLITSITSDGGIKATIESLRRRMAEADRKRAIQRLRGELQRIERQVGELLTAVGVQAVALKRAGSLTSPELGPLCERIIDLEDLLVEQKKELAKLEAEMAAQAAASAASTADAPLATAAVPQAVVCAKCGRPLPQTAEFCPHCGQAKIAPPSSPAYCAHCGASLRAGARFCARCGKEVVG